MDSLTPIATNIWSYLADFLSIIIIAGVLFIYGFYCGKEKLVSVIISLYASALIFLNFPYIKKFLFFRSSLAEVNWSKFLIFVIIFMIVHFALNKIIASRLSWNRIRHWGELLILSVLTTAVLIVIIHHILPLSSIYSITPSIDAFFSSDNVIFYTLAFPFIALYFMHRD